MTSNPSGSFGVATQRAELTGVTKTGTNEFQLTYDSDVNVGTLANIVAYSEDGQAAYPATSSSAAGPATTLRVVFPGVQEFGEKVVAVADTGGGVRDRDSGSASTPSYFGLRSAPITPGFTDGPDLRQVVVSSANNTATFRFDQPIDTTNGNNADANDDGTKDGGAPNPQSLQLLDADGNRLTGTGVNSTTGGDVVVQFTGSAAPQRGRWPGWPRTRCATSRTTTPRS